MRPPELWRSSSAKLSALLSAVFGLSVTILFAVVYVATARSMADNLDQQIDGQLATLSKFAASRDSAALARTIDEQIGTGGELTLYMLLQGPDGKAIAGNLRPLPIAPGWLDLPPTATVDAPKGRDHIIRARQIELAGGQYLTLGRDTHPLRELREVIVQGFALCLAVTIVLALASGLFMSSRVLRRLNAINLASREIVEGDLTRRVPTRGIDDEYDNLAVRFNTMLDRLQKLVDNLQHVTTDIAHDLRTPLSRLRQRLELTRLSALTIADYDLAIEGAIQELDNVLGTFTSILRIAQIEAGARRAGFAPVDLSRVLEQLVETYIPVAEDAQHRLTSRIAPGVWVRGDGQLLVQLFANLIENSLRHTPPDTQVTIDMEPRDGSALAVVRDNGPGIPKAIRETVLQRFVRGDPSRTTTGNGLGLSLAAAVAELHDAALQLDDSNPGLRVTVHLPMADRLAISPVHAFVSM